MRSMEKLCEILDYLHQEVRQWLPNPWGTCNMRHASFWVPPLKPFSS